LAAPWSGNFTLRSDSPAIALGFQPFDWRAAGPRRHAPIPADFAEYALPPTAPIAAAVATVEIVAATESSDGGRVDARVVIRNVSTLPVAGEYRFEALAYDGSDGRWTAGGIRVSLPPGGERVETVSFKLPSGVRQAWIMACGDEQIVFSGAALATLNARISMPTLESTGDSAAVFAAVFQRGFPITLERGETLILDAKAALVDGALVLTAAVADPRTFIAASPWQGSSVELFLSADRTSRPHQFAVLPPRGTGTGEILGLGGAQVPSGTTFRSELTAIGWTWKLSLPLDLPGLPPSPTRFRFDLICNANSPVAGENLLRLPVWGTLADNQDAGFLAEVVVDECS